MATSGFFYKLRDLILDLLNNNDPNERIYVEEGDLISEGCYKESYFFNYYRPKVLDSVEKIIGLDRKSIKYHLIGKIIVNRGVSYHG